MGRVPTLRSRQESRKGSFGTTSLDHIHRGGRGARIAIPLQAQRRRRALGRQNLRGPRIRVRSCPVVRFGPGERRVPVSARRRPGFPTIASPTIRLAAYPRPHPETTGWAIAILSSWARSTTACVSIVLLLLLRRDDRRLRALDMFLFYVFGESCSSYVASSGSGGRAPALRRDQFCLSRGGSVVMLLGIPGLYFRSKGAGLEANGYLRHTKWYPWRSACPRPRRGVRGRPWDSRQGDDVTVPTWLNRRTRAGPDGRIGILPACGSRWALRVHALLALPMDRGPVVGVTVMVTCHNRIVYAGLVPSAEGHEKRIAYSR